MQQGYWSRTRAPVHTSSQWLGQRPSHLPCILSRARPAAPVRPYQPTEIHSVADCRPASYTLLKAVRWPASLNSVVGGRGICKGLRHFVACRQSTGQLQVHRTQTARGARQEREDRGPGTGVRCVNRPTGQCMLATSLVCSGSVLVASFHASGHGFPGWEAGSLGWRRSNLGGSLKRMAVADRAVTRNLFKLNSLASRGRENSPSRAKAARIRSPNSSCGEPPPARAALPGDGSSWQGAPEPPRVDRTSVDGPSVDGALVDRPWVDGHQWTDK
eukprot:365844-Chlamydomonas_euryale.AAC.13